MENRVVRVILGLWVKLGWLDLLETLELLVQLDFLDLLVTEVHRDLLEAQVHLVLREVKDS